MSAQGIDDVPLWIRPAFFVAALGLLASTAVVASVALHEYSSRQYRDAVQQHKVSLEADDLLSGGHRAVSDFVDPPRDLDGAALAAEQADSLNDLDALLSDYQANFAQTGDAGVRRMLAFFATSRERELAELRAGDYADAEVLDQTALDSFDDLAAAADAAADAHYDRANRVSTATSAGIALAYVVAVVAGGLLFWRFRRQRRRLEDAQTEREVLRRSDARFRPLVQRSTDIIATVDGTGRFTYVSPAVQRVLGLGPEACLGASVVGFVCDEERPAFETFLAEVEARPRFTSAMETRMRAADGSERYVDVVCTNLLDDEGVRGIVLNLRDVSERRALETQLRHQAFNDSLTGLANRLRFMDRLEHAMLRGRRNGQGIGVLYADLDHFKNVNDDLGHAAGDALLQEVARRMQGCLRPGDTVSRLGGDEFAVLLEEATDAAEARAIADRLLHAIQQPFLYAEQQIAISASVGIVLADPRTLSAGEVLRDADVAMYDAKRNGRGRAQQYDPAMRQSLVERVRLINDLNGAVERGEFVVYYQPTVDIETERVQGFEALLRWRHPQRGLIMPNDFIPLAEETQAIHPIGEMVLNEACRQMQTWIEHYPAARDVSMSVNVSAKQIQRPGFVEIVQRALRSSGLDPRRLVLELTETALVSEPERVIETLQALRQLGARVALDDFGTGYSSLGHLRRFPLDELKIDRAFVEGLETDEKEGRLIQSVIELGRALNLEIVAEGIESAGQLARLRQLHCDVGQGFLFSEAVAPAEAEQLLSGLELPVQTPQRNIPRAA